METTVRLNRSGNLLGVLNCPTSPTHGAIAMVFINAGFLHHVGPYRLYTDLCRELAAQGIYALRFDLAGLGDSLPAPLHVSNGVNANYFEAANSIVGPVGDIHAALNYLEHNRGINQFIVCGLCSGANDSLEIAMVDDRIIGALLIDGPGFKTPLFHLYHYLLHYPRRLVNPKKLGVLKNRLLKSNSEQVLPDMNDDIRREISEQELRDMANHLVEQNIHTLFLYTGGVSDYYNHSGQFNSMFPELRHCETIKSHYMPESDHLFMLNSHRNALKRTVVEWVLQVAMQTDQLRNAA